MLTRRCNLSCPFCYGPDPNSGNEISGIEWVSLVEYFIGLGIRRFVLAGGEPTTHPDFYKIVQGISSLGGRIALQTNGFFPERVYKVLPYIDWLCLPIDAISSAVSKSLRSDESATSRVLELVSQVRSLSSDVKLKIGTVVTSLNLAEFPAITDVITHLMPDSWKIHEMRERGAGRLSFSELWTSIESQTLRECTTRARVAGVPLSISSGRDSIGAYLIINPDSDVLVPDSSFYLNFGHSLQPGSRSVKPSPILAAMHALFDQNHDQNLDRAFPSWREGDTAPEIRVPLQSTTQLEIRPSYWLDR